MLDENSVPGKNWSTYQCIVKRTCNTYKAARLQLKAMENMTDMEEEVPTEINQRQKESDIIDLNHLIQIGGDSPATVPPITVTTSDNAMADRISLNDVNTSFLLKNDNEEVLKNQAQILEILQDVQNTQKIILQQLAKHEVQYNELWNKMADYSVTTTEINREGSVEERFPPLKTVEELYQLEDNLNSPEFRSKYFKIMSTLCSPGLGAKGTNLCYKVIDHFFSRELLTLVSWSGNSRDQNEKAAFKFFTRIRQIFFSIIHYADATIGRCNYNVAEPKNLKKMYYNDITQNDAAESNIEPTADVEYNVDDLNSD